MEESERDITEAWELLELPQVEVIEVFRCVRANVQRVRRVLYEQSRVESHLFNCTVLKLNLDGFKLIEEPVCTAGATSCKVRR